ncbi:MAG: hypothetical protein ACLT9P_10500 [Evtepia gabavorous]
MAARVGARPAMPNRGAVTAVSAWGRRAAARTPPPLPATLRMSAVSRQAMSQKQLAAVGSAAAARMGMKGPGLLPQQGNVSGGR